MINLHRRAEEFLPVVIFFGLAVIFFAPIIFQNKTFFDADIGRQYIPWYSFSAEKIKSGQLPLWSHGSENGYPLFAEGETGSLNPFLRILYFLFPANRAFNLIYPLHFFLISFFSYLFMRAFSLSKFASLVGAISFAYGLFFVTKIIHTSIIMSAAWVPLGFYAIHRGLIGRLRLLFLLPPVIALIFFAGHPQIGLISVLGFSLYAFLVLGFRLGKRAVLVFMMLVCGLVLASVQIFPLIELAHYSSRPSSDVNFIFSFSFPVTHLLTFILPDFFGRVTPEAFDGSPWYGGSYWEFALYIGLLPFIAAVINIIFSKKNKFEWIMIILLIVSVLAAIGGYLRPYRILVRLLIMFFPIPLRVSSRFLLITTLTLTILAASGLDKFIQTIKVKGKVLNLLKFFMVFLVVVDLYVHGFSYNKVYDSDYIYSPPAPVEKIKKNLGREFNIFSEVEFLALEQTRLSLQPNLQLLWHINSAAITSPLPLFPYQDLVKRENYSAILPKLGVTTLLSKDNLPDKQLEQQFNGINTYTIANSLPVIFFSDEYLVKNSRQEALYELNKPSSNNKKVTVEKNISIDSSLNLDSNINLIKFDDTQVSMQTSSNKRALLVFLDNFYPGWEAYIDKHKVEVLRINGLYKGIIVDAGNHAVAFQFSPKSLKWGIILSLIGAGFYLLTLALTFKKFMPSLHEKYLK